MKNIIKSYFSNKRGMTLVEVLTAMAILSLLIFCFTPLFLTYFESITIAGERVWDVQNQSGILQTVIGNFDAGKGGNYSANVTEMGLELTTPASASLSRDNNGTTVSTTLNGAVTVAFGDEIDDIKADFLASDPNNLKQGYATIKAQGSSSGLVCYPKSLTDDFIEAKIIVYGSGGISFANASYVNDFKLTCGLNGGTSLSNGTDYTVRKLASSMVEFTIYGGGKVSYETSPLLINYKNGQHILQVEVDAPSMIMVGEADDEGKYYYYVSRGEIIDGNDSDTNKDELAIIRREMKSTDAHNSSTVTLNAAMNDVEWVPADSGDGYNVDSAGKKYGYYVMCGDNGQVRRFWRNNTTGNYYWGGDYTHYSDYDFVQVNDSGAQAHIYTTDKNGSPNASPVYNTETSFKFISQRTASTTQSGFNVSSKEYNLVGSLVNLNTALLRSLTVVSVTRADDGEFYGADGEIYFYKFKKNSTSTLATLAEAHAKGSVNGVSVNEWVNTVNSTAHGWLETDDNSYYDINGLTVDSNGKINGISKDAYPITLTSVDAIRINTPNKTDVKSDGSYYFTATGNGDTQPENAVTNLNYPQSSYTLYCGYIPAMMDLFASKTGSTGSYKYPTGWQGTYGHSDGTDGTFYEIPTGTGLTRAGNRKTLQDNAEKVSYWRMTLGVTPYLTSGAALTTSSTGNLAYYRKYTSWLVNYYDYLVHYPYTNLKYAITGKFYDAETFNNNKDKIKAAFENFEKTGYIIATPDTLINHHDNIQQNVTNGEIVDITISYLSHPYAISVSANPTDDIVYDLSNNKGDGHHIYYWNNRRETITFLDSASTVIPSGEKDIPVSLMVGYVLGGTVSYSNSGTDSTVDVGSVMNNGIVFLRAGDYRVETQNSANGETYEYLAIDKDGYKLATESNVFHQFYYLNSRSVLEKERTGSGAHTEYAYEPTKGENIGNLYGADYWQNNRHIQYKSLAGGTASEGNDGSYEYLRSHPMTNTKVTCVSWGVTWNGYPEAMWGTENGTVLSWWVNTTSTQGSHTAYDWNDRSVDAEFQSYKWVDNVNGKTFSVVSDGNTDSVGSAVWGSSNSNATTFSVGSNSYKYFYDKTSQATNLWSTIGFISTLENINDITYDNDMWVAVGDQSDKDPADYCASGQWNGGGEIARAFTGNGRGGSWVNVRYWVDANGSGKHADDNAYYHWRAVKISNNENYNIVQINNLNGIWVATGYEDANNNEEYDNGERTVVCWARNPLGACDENMDGKWSEEVQFYANNGASMTALDQNKVGGINSCATRTE